MTPTHSTDQLHHVESLREQLRQAGRGFCAAAHTIEMRVLQLVDLEQRLRAAETAVGLPREPQAPARDLAADVLLYAARELHPFIPHATAELAEIAEAALTTAPPRAMSLRTGE
jgi:hypothetical protein